LRALFILPFAITAFYFISINGFNDFKIEDPPVMLLICLAGPMTVIPLFLYVRGVELCDLVPTGNDFFI
jgi:chloramphenicol-sensitive protein RarD